jgi:putative endonuclease
MDKQYYVYILTNPAGSVLYTGVTNDLKRRVFQHKNKLAEGFTKKYHVDTLVYYAVCGSVEGAILEEKRIKAGSRQKKLDMINAFNRTWHDLYEEL